MLNYQRVSFICWNRTSAKFRMLDWFGMIWGHVYFVEAPANRISLQYNRQLLGHHFSKPAYDSQVMWLGHTS